MRKLVASLLLLLSLPAWGGTIVVFGDSLSAGYGLEPGQGWVTLLKDRLERKGFNCQVINASISGDTSAGGAARIEAVLAQHRPEILILELGANDGLRGLSPEAMKANLSSIILKAKAAGAQILLLGMEMPPNYGPRYTEKFTSVYSGLAEEHQLPKPPFLLERVALEPQMMQADNLHPNAAGQPLLLDTVWPALRPLLRR
ncbi:MAG: arylesterase [Gammaproteobacteria bacterium]|nr:arylesterase [Gammaproteobacteria bacterium]MCW8840320.1 arylesterase [Gammaproteobacteria bacterium]MCW8928581.1 arylesterase [Gammaproteobacteria bacterium]MCW8959397.1 arylesterase [Gammaproteobacteria bacterium]MCW8972101.1 arylesterase [Gammaproteobacteria bacterium]